MFERFTDRARRVVVLAQEEARMLNHNYIGTEHILLGLIHEGEGAAAKALESLGISLEAVRQQVEEIIGQGQQAPSGHIPFTPRAKKVLELSLREALQLGHNYIGTEHILLGLIREGDGVAAQVLVKLGADLNRVRQQVIQLLHGYQGKEPASAGTSAESAPSTSLVLDQFGRNLTAAAREGKLDPVIGREKEIERVMQVLSRHAKNIPVLVAEAGVDKTAVVEGLAQKIVQGEVPGTIKDKQLYTLDLGALVADPTDRGDFEERLKKVLKEICTRGDIILFIDEIHTLVGAGAAEGAIDAASILKPMLARGELQTIGATTLDEYRKYLEKDAALERRFQPIQVAEPTISHTIEILKGLRDRYEAYHRVSITDGALVASAQLADRYISDRFLPDKAIDVIDEAGSRMRIRRMTAPDLREYDEKIAQVRREKDSAINSQDFDKAAALRDNEKQLLAKKATREKEWKVGDMDVVAEVNEEVIIESVSRLSGVPVHRILAQLGNRPPLDLREYDEKIAQVHWEIESAMDSQEFEKVAALEDTWTHLLAEKATREKEWKSEILAPQAPISRPRPSRLSDELDVVQDYSLLNDQPAGDVESDLLGTAEIAAGIASILTASTSPFVLAVDGGWGVGKSTLLRHIQSFLNNQTDIVCVGFNAWTARGSNALEGLIKSVLGQLDRNVLRRSIRRLAKRRGVLGIARLLAVLVARFLGAPRLVDEIWDTLSVDAKSRNEMKDLIASMLSDWMQHSSQPGRALVVFIDDLDRCADDAVVQVCEAVKLYLDAPGLIFVIACDLSVLARGVSVSARGGVGEGRAYLEKIIQVSYRVPQPNESKVRKLILDYGKRSGTSGLIEDMVMRILVERAGRNPRRIKRLINSFVLEYRLNPAWHNPPLDSSLLITAILLQHIYTPFYDYLVDDNSPDDPIAEFLDYVIVRSKAADPPSLNNGWWAIVRRVFQEHGMPTPDRFSATSEKLMQEVERLENVLPDTFPAFARNDAFVALLRSIGDKETHQALRAQLISRPLVTETINDEMAFAR